MHERTYISDELDSGHYLSEWTNDAHRSSFHNLNNLVDDRSFLQLKMERHNSRKRRPSLFDAIDDNGYEREELEAKQEVEDRLHHKHKADNPGRQEVSDSEDLGYDEAVRRKRTKKENAAAVLRDDYTKYLGKFDENITLENATKEYLAVMKPTLDSRAYPLLYGNKNRGRNNPTVTVHDDDGGTRVEVELPKQNVLDEDGQADELTDAEQHDSVFLLEGPIWASLSMEEKEKIQQGARMRHSMISFVENHARIKSHLNAGLYTKDVIDEVVDRTGALLPEHITSLLMGFFRELFTRMVGQFMQNNFGEDNVPGGGAGMGAPDVTQDYWFVGEISAENPQ